MKANLTVKAAEPIPAESCEHSGEADRGGPCMASSREEGKQTPRSQGGGREDRVLP